MHNSRVSNKQQVPSIAQAPYSPLSINYSPTPILFIACAQAVQSAMHTARIRSRLTHIVRIANRVAVQKWPIYTPLPHLFYPLHLSGYAQPFLSVNSLLVPTIHRPYKNKNKCI